MGVMNKIIIIVFSILLCGCLSNNSKDEKIEDEFDGIVDDLKNVTFVAETNEVNYSIGENVAINIIIRNNNSQPIKLNLFDKYDGIFHIITNETGYKAWSKSPRQPLTTFPRLTLIISEKSNITLGEFYWNQTYLDYSCLQNESRLGTTQVPEGHYYVDGMIQVASFEYKLFEKKKIQINE